MCIRLEMRRLRMRLSAIKNIRDRLTFGGRERRYVHQRLYPVTIQAGDHSAAIRVSHKDCWPSRSLQCASKRSYVIRERCERNWRARYFKTFLS